MNQKVILLKGLPASGKSTYAKQIVIENENAVRVNKDDLRAMLHNSKWSRSKEKEVLKIRNELILFYLKDNKKLIIIDDTNFHEKHEFTIRSLVKEYNKDNNQNVQFEIDDTFCKIPVDECIYRDTKRENSVGEKVILDMYYKYLHKEDFYPIDENLPHCIICDIDGTIADMKDIRGPFEWDKVHLDKPKMNIITLVKSYIMNEFDNSDKLIFFSGRDSSSYDLTLKWLNGFFLGCDFDLYMRETGDIRKDTIVKREMFEKQIRNKYNVSFVIDDRRQVVNMWREIGLTCLEVSDHRF